MPFFEKAPEPVMSPNGPKLGDWRPSGICSLVPQEMIEALCEKSAKNAKCPLYRDVYQILFDRLKSADEPAFCLKAVLQYLDRVDKIFPIKGRWTLALFEIWLNSQRSIDPDLQLSIRSKIVGRHLPRSAYQILFPIGSGQTLLGSHIITAHISPDLDTCIASFWGWSDAFAARLSSHVHHWNLPGGILAPQDRLVVDELMGPELLQQLPTSQKELCLKAVDLIDSKALIELPGDKKIDFETDLDEQTIAVMVDAKGSYLGELNFWDRIDLIPIITSIALGLQWITARAQSQIGDAKSVKRGHSWSDLRQLALEQIPPIAALARSTLLSLEQFVHRYFGLPAGLKTKLAEIGQGTIACAGLQPFALVADLLTGLMNKDEMVCDDGSFFMRQFESAAADAQTALHRLDVLIAIKTEILKRPFSPLRSDDELSVVRAELQKCPARAVVLQESSDRSTPLGAVFAAKLANSTLGTATFRDFCNRQEIQAPPYLQITSVLDHHKTDLQTAAIATCCSADVQSCNVLIAELALDLNDRCAGAKKKSDQEQLASLLIDRTTLNDRAKLRLLQRLIPRYLAQKGDWYVHKEREMIEYLSLLYAIFDDTDLLMKATPRDVRCVVKLLNRAKSLQCQYEVEIIDEEGLEEKADFSRQLATRILRHEETYSLYSQVFAFRFESIEKAMRTTSDGVSNSWFADTKEQNGCARVGQSKLFTRNIETFGHLRPKLVTRFIDLAKSSARDDRLVLHLHMCSTIADAGEVYEGQTGKNYSHCDQLWFWIADLSSADRALDNFLTSFYQAKELKEQMPRLEIFNDRNERLKKIFNIEKAPWSITESSCDATDQIFAILHVKATSLNSRKAAIAPHLPINEPNMSFLK